MNAKTIKFIFTLCLFLAFIVRRYWTLRLRLKSGDHKSVDRCPCGYQLDGLEFARCPECGRVVGFDATPEQLGLTLKELKRMQQKRQERAASKQ